MLTEWNRVLKDGGKLILELPCMNKVLRQIYDCVQTGSPFAMHATWFVFWGDPSYRDPLMCHKWGYTKEMLEALLLRVGFSRVVHDAPRYHFKNRDMRVTAFK